jgi:hypothetical protein
VRINCGSPYDDTVAAGLRRLGEIVSECAAEQSAKLRMAA